MVEHLCFVAHCYKQFGGAGEVGGGGEYCMLILSLAPRSSAASHCL
jgi:hypothetical protein